MSGVPACRFCGQPLHLSLVDLGTMPLANSYLSAEQLASPEPEFPLHPRVCSSCRLVQVDPGATPAEIFSHYAYFSSISSSWVEHARRFASGACERWQLGRESKVVEVASNDGYLLRHFTERQVPVLGVEPAANIADAANARGIPTRNAFFGLDLARTLVSDGHAADLLVGFNVLAHVPDINDFVAGLATLLAPDGVLVMEFPHLLRMLEETQFDTIYHEHCSYLSLLAVERIFAQHGLRVFDVIEVPTHGGSLRVMACRMASTRHSDCVGAAKVRQDEAAAGLDADAAYEDFGRRVAAVRAGFCQFMQAALDAGKTIVAYGAAAKGNTFLNYCAVEQVNIAYVVDRSPHKQGLFLPGSRLPILAPERIRETRPDYVLILPWNLRDEISIEMAEIGSWGGRFVVAIPQVELFHAPVHGSGSGA